MLEQIRPYRSTKGLRTLKRIMNEFYKNITSTITEGIENNLHRNLPEYAGYQTEEGTGALRWVLQAYSFMNPDLGSCQVRRIFFFYINTIRFHWSPQARNILAAAWCDIFNICWSWLSTLVICPKNRHFCCGMFFVVGCSWILCVRFLFFRS